MSRIRSTNTRPEMLVRSALHKMGYRFRLNGKVGKNYSSKGILQGKPDIVLAKYRLVIFINGCFWHHHINCKRANIPKTNQEYWQKKLSRNVERDKENIRQLKSDGWKVIVIWECQIDKKTLPELLKREIDEAFNSW
ncbi:MAG: DNA mismatch endonuclease Vsr [Spirochaetales bacterium]|nr:DNA mismatch endonuclease Vsr [Spirochaetales bacterium]